MVIYSFLFPSECWKVNAGHFWDRAEQGLGSTLRQDHESLQDDWQENVSITLFSPDLTKTLPCQSRPLIFWISTGGSRCLRCDSSRSCRKRWSRRSRRKTSPSSVSMTSTTMRLVSFLPPPHAHWIPSSTWTVLGSHKCHFFRWADSNAKDGEDHPQVRPPVPQTGPGCPSAAHHPLHAESGAHHHSGLPVGWQGQ